MDNSFGVGQIDADNFGIVNCHAVYIGKSGEINCIVVIRLNQFIHDICLAVIWFVML